jgi:hypothetical protein
MALTVLNQIKEIRASGEVVLWVDNYTNDDTNWVIVGTDPFSSIDYPNGYIVSRSDRPCVSKSWTASPPVNVTGTKNQMPQYRLDVYARSLNGSGEVFINSSSISVGNNWNWYNGTAYTLDRAAYFAPPCYDQYIVSINNKIVGLYLTTDKVYGPPLITEEGTNGTAIYVTIYIVGVGANAGTAQVKAALYKKSDYSFLQSTEELSITYNPYATANLEFNDPKPFLVKGEEYYLVVWGNVTSGAEPGVFISTKSPYADLTGRAIEQSLTYGSFPSTLSGTTKDYLETFSRLTVTGKQLAPPGSIPGFMTYVFLGMLLLLCVYAFAKKR